VRDAVTAAWRPAGLLYLAACLLAFAIGLWPEVVYLAKDADIRPAPRPALQVLGSVLAAFFLLVYPLVLLRRREQREGVSRIEAVIECVSWMVLGVPVYAMAAYISDAVVADVVRTVLALAVLWPLAWAAGALLGRPWARGAVLGGLLVVTLGAPAGWYLLAEFIPALSRNWLWHAAPLTFLWENAAARQSGWWPQPLWAAGLWLSAAALLGTIAAACRPEAEPTPAPGTS
jgi:hypothetical protein